MAAYAALVSLMDLIEQIQHHPDPPLSLDQNQAKSLTERISFLQGFLEDFHSQEIRGLESRIAHAAHAAEDVIESQILLIASESITEQDLIESHVVTDQQDQVIESKILLAADLYGGLQRVIQDMEFIEKEVIDTRKKRPRVENDDQLPRRSMLPPPLGSSNTTTMVGFDHILIQIMDRLTQNQSRKLDIIPIVGMGGAGKTTLARNIYETKLIAEHFHTRSWVTISQAWVVREVLIEILLCQSNHESREALSQESEDKLGNQLYKSLFGRKYLIVMDDVWSIEAWEKLKFFFPDNNNGSRIMITTRLSKLALDLGGSRAVDVDLLDKDASWDLLCKKVFGEKDCPFELEEIGRTIARNCRGLPLSIVTIGGLLAKSSMTREYWEYVAENLSSIVNSEDGERSLRILSLSYIHLPVHLKPCFLYMGLFPEDHRISASRLVRLWVAEGFLKPISAKSLEVVGQDYLKDLVERNLISVVERGFTGEIKFCIVHDLLRDLCLREAQKENFFSVVRSDSLQGNGISNTQRRIAIHWSTSNDEDPFDPRTPYAAPSLRSCIIDSKKVLELISLGSVRHLRILAGVNSYTGYDIVPPVSSRFLCLETSKYISSLSSMVWNLQTLSVSMSMKFDVALDIWRMPQLRHAKINFINLPDPPSPGSSSVDGVLENLQTLSNVRNFKCSEEAVKRFPNVKKLRVSYNVEGRKPKDYCLDNLGRLEDLESLAIELYQTRWMLDGLTLPHSLKRLTLTNLILDDDTMSKTIGGSLLLLEVLKLTYCSFKGGEWNPVEGQFCLLKYLKLSKGGYFKCWNAESTHFPRLEHLDFSGCSSLEEFPWGIGDIASLRLIKLYHVSTSLVISAKQMLEEQEEQLGNVELVIQVTADRGEKDQLLEMASNNFKVIYY